MPPSTACYDFSAHTPRSSLIKQNSRELAKEEIAFTARTFLLYVTTSEARREQIFYRTRKKSNLVKIAVKIALKIALKCASSDASQNFAKQSRQSRCECAKISRKVKNQKENFFFSFSLLGEL